VRPADPAGGQHDEQRHPSATAGVSTGGGRRKRARQRSRRGACGHRQYPGRSAGRAYPLRGGVRRSTRRWRGIASRWRRRDSSPGPRPCSATLLTESRSHRAAPRAARIARGPLLQRCGVAGQVSGEHGGWRRAHHQARRRQVRPSTASTTAQLRTRPDSCEWCDHEGPGRPTRAGTAGR
jgi:hypothetical protein